MTETHTVALSFEDGVTRFITCRPDQTVADASYRQRINIPLDCRDGACGTCRALCESGSYDGGSYLEDALPAADAAAGYVLPCSMKPRSDLVLQIAGTSDAAKTEAATYTGTLAVLHRLSDTTVKIGIEIPNRSELAFLPGQYVNIAVPGTDAIRSYSFSNAAGDELLTFLIKLTPGGAMSEYLARRAAVGDTLSFTGPNGSFFLREADRPLLLLAGGTGLAPILSMLRTMRAAGSTRAAHLIYGVSTDADLVGVDEITEISSSLDGFTWDHCVADPASSAPNRGPERAYVTSLIAPEHLNGGDLAIYLCGPPPMVEAVRTHLDSAGITPTGFYYEKFGLATARPTSSPPPAAGDGADAAGEEELLPASDARAVAGQVMLPAPAPIAPAPVARVFVTPGRFAGKVVVVTGAAQGIGEHTARRIHAEGGAVVLADRSELVKELADEIAGPGRPAVAVTVDLEHSEGAETMIEQTLSAFDRIDVLVNNVGGAINFKPFTEFTAAQIRAEIDRSLMTALYSCHAALPPMIRQGRGVIVNVSSAATRGVHRIPYSAAKGGINALTASLAMEHAGNGVRVVATAPGGTAAPPRRISRGTPVPGNAVEQAWFDAHIEQTIASSLLARYGTLDEQAAAICFLASDEASYITGTVLPVAGGDQG
ncbi:benzoate 1,2-dioxygenase electron transfer component BenC [Mycolicibacterium sp.]|uniref:benzoate 1,2-dioxygenase electron transfer component BenC n=1 Tax=Mycolicibacterium sp. TaxID=2320850 RepID=UPI003D117BFF